jgi:hypothetical protein
MLWLERRPGDDPTLFARRIDESPAGMGPVEELGMLPTSFAQGGARARACRSAKALFVDVADSGDRRALLVHRDGRWHPVLTPSAAGGTLTCSGDRAAYTWAVPASAGPGLVVHHTVCSAASCSTQTVALSSIDDTGKDQIAVTTLGDRIVLVTLEDALELRIAPLLDLPAAPVRFLADISEGQLGGSRVYEARLRTRRDTAVLLLRTREGFVALRVSADAQVDPVSVIPLAP